MSEAATVVFISHDANRTGAPIMLLHLLRWLRAQRSIPFEIVLRDGTGVLRAEFAKLGRVTVWEDAPHSDRMAPRSWARGWRRPSPGLPHDVGRLVAANDVRIVYSNTITNGRVIDALASPCRTVITHVHELRHWIDYRVDPATLRSTLRHTSQYVAASRAVEAQLLHMGIAQSQIQVVHESIDLRERPAEDAGPSVRRLHGIPPDAFVVGAVGTTDWRKAPDLFIQVAAIIARARPDLDMHFVWLGGESGGSVAAELRHDVVGAGLQARVHFVAAKPNPLDYLAAFDVLALTSREDPFPLVCLEAASVGKPTVCFDGAGGAPEFVESDAGRVVPYLDLVAFGQVLATLAEDRPAAAALGRRAQNKVQAYDVTVTGPRILGIIDAHLAGRR